MPVELCAPRWILSHSPRRLSKLTAGRRADSVCIVLVVRFATATVCHACISTIGLSRKNAYTIVTTVVETATVSTVVKSNAGRIAARYYHRHPHLPTVAFNFTTVSLNSRAKWTLFRFAYDESLWIFDDSTTTTYLCTLRWFFRNNMHINLYDDNIKHTDEYRRGGTDKNIETLFDILSKTYASRAQHMWWKVPGLSNNVEWFIFDRKKLIEVSTGILFSLKFYTGVFTPFGSFLEHFDSTRLYKTALFRGNLINTWGSTSSWVRTVPIYFNYFRG